MQKKIAMRRTFGMSCPPPGHSVEKLLILYPVDHLPTYFSTYIFSHFVFLKVFPIKSILAKLGSFLINKLQEIGILEIPAWLASFNGHIFLLKNCICIFIKRVHLYLTLCVFEKSALNVSVFVFVQKKILDKGQF